MSYENRGDSEYHSSSHEYRIPSDEMKNRDNEFQTGQRSRAVNAAEDYLPLRKRMRRLGFLMSTLTVAACTVVIAGGAPKQEELPPQETVVEAAAESVESARAETVTETQAAEADGVVLTEDERVYMDSLSKALADRDYERAKELIIDPRLKTIFIDKYGEESHIYADGKCYPMEEFTGAGLWIAWMNEEEHKEWPIGAWAQFENGAANGEGVTLDCFYYREDYYASHAYTWYVGQFADGLANGEGEYLDEYFGEGGIESSTKLKGEFQDGQIYSGTVEGFYDGANAPDISYVIQDGKSVKKVENIDGETVTYTGEELEDDRGFFGNDVFID